MHEIRLKKLQNQIRARVAELIGHELKDPRLGMVTITRVSLDREMQVCRIYWTVLGDERARRRNGSALDHAKGFIRKSIAAVLHTRTVPEIHFEYDMSIEGVARIEQTLLELRQEREAKDQLPRPDGDPSPGEGA